MLCRGSGKIFGGYRQDLAEARVMTTCVDCWRRVVEIPIQPEPRTGVISDGQTVMIIRKQVIDHEFGSACAMYIRRDSNKWIFYLSVILTVASVVQFISHLLSR